MGSADSPLSLLRDSSLLKTDALINGEWVSGADRFAVTDPSTGQTLAHVANLTDRDAHMASDAANKVWGIWCRKTAKERSNILRSWLNLIMANQDDLARIMTAE